MNNNPLVQKYQHYMNESARLLEELQLEDQYITILENLLIKLMEEEKDLSYGSERWKKLQDKNAERVRRNKRVWQGAATGSNTVKVGSDGAATRVDWKELKKTYGDRFQRGFGG